jgi:hypothetical protein
MNLPLHIKLGVGGVFALLGLVACGGSTTDTTSQIQGSVGGNSNTGGTVSGGGTAGNNTSGTAGVGTSGAGMGTSGGSSVGGTGGSPGTGGNPGTGGGPGTGGMTGQLCQQNAVCTDGQNCQFSSGNCSTQCNCKGGQYQCNQACGTGGSGGSPPNDCSPGQKCAPGTGCGFANGNCKVTCQCSDQGTLACEKNCGTGGSSGSGGGTSGCTPGAMCNQGTGCGYSEGNCSISCKCAPNGTMECVKNCSTPACPPVVDPGAFCPTQGEVCLDSCQNKCICDNNGWSCPAGCAPKCPDVKPTGGMCNLPAGTNCVFDQGGIVSSCTCTAGGAPFNFWVCSGPPSDVPCPDQTPQPNGSCAGYKAGQSCSYPPLTTCTCVQNANGTMTWGCAF